jgi:TRAP-type mannitol/chloroaromatic compound transport system permease small subunit
MGLLLRFSALIDRLNVGIGQSVSWLILLAVLVSTINAIVRKAFDMSSNAWLELQWYLFAASYMLAASYTLQRDEHIRIDVLYGALPRAVRHWINLLGHLFMLMPFTALMIYESWPYMLVSYHQQEYSSNAGGLILWPVKALVLAGFVMLFLQGLSEIIKQIAIMRGLIEDKAERPHGAALEVEEHMIEPGARS